MDTLINCVMMAAALWFIMFSLATLAIVLRCTGLALIWIDQRLQEWNERRVNH